MHFAQFSFQPNRQRKIRLCDEISRGILPFDPVVCNHEMRRKIIKGLRIRDLRFIPVAVGILIPSRRNPFRLRIHLAYGIAERFGSLSHTLPRRIPYLECPPQLVPEFPQNSARVFVPMFVDVLHPSRRFLGCSASQVERDLRPRSDQFTKAQELVRPERIVFRHAPGDIQHAHAFVDVKFPPKRRSGVFIALAISTISGSIPSTLSAGISEA